MGGLEESKRGDSIDFEELAEGVEILRHCWSEGPGDAAVVTSMLLS